MTLSTVGVDIASLLDIRRFASSHRDNFCILGTSSQRDIRIVLHDSCVVVAREQCHQRRGTLGCVPVERLLRGRGIPADVRLVPQKQHQVAPDFVEQSRYVDVWLP